MLLFYSVRKRQWRWNGSDASGGDDDGENDEIDDDGVDIMGGDDPQNSCVWFDVPSRL